MELALRLTLAVVFLGAGWQKARNPYLFRRALEGYPLKPTHVVVERLLPSAEIGLGGALILGANTAFVLATVCGALVVITALSMVASLSSQGCSCTPVWQTASRASLLFRNGTLLGIAIVALLLNSSPVDRTVDVVPLVLAGAVGALAPSLRWAFLRKVRRYSASTPWSARQVLSPTPRRAV